MRLERRSQSAVTGLRCEWGGKLMVVGGARTVSGSGDWTSASGRDSGALGGDQQLSLFSQIQLSSLLSHGASFHIPVRRIMMQSSRPSESLGSP